MNTLYPIIRRKRRPLIVADAPPVVVGRSEPDGPPSRVQPVAAKPAESVLTDSKPQTSDDQTAPTSES